MWFLFQSLIILAVIGTNIQGNGRQTSTSPAGSAWSVWIATQAIERSGINRRWGYEPRGLA